VLTFKFKFDCANDSLQQLGEFLPNLRELNLKGSVLNSLRDLGINMQNLIVLNVSSTQLLSLSGIVAFPRLQELYASYNRISDLSELYFNETIEILDLEGNDIEDIQNLEYLQSISKLQDLNLINCVVA